MSKICRYEIVIGALAASAIWTIVFLWQSTLPSPNTQTASHRSEHADDESAKRTAEERIADYTWWLAVLTAGLVGVSFIQFHFLSRADKTARISADAAAKSAKVAENALFVGERPYIFVTGAAFREALDRQTFNYDGDQIWPWINFKIDNHGRTPAYIIEVCADSACVTTLPDTPIYREQTIYDESRHVIGRQDSAIIGYTFKTQIDGRVMNDIAVPSYLGGNSRQLFAYGYIKYLDIFGYIHTVGFCWRYNLNIKAFVNENRDAYNYRKIEKAAPDVAQPLAPPS